MAAIMKPRREHTEILKVEFGRPEAGPLWQATEMIRELVVSNLPGWQSNGGPTRGHEARALPFSLEVRLPEANSQLLRLYVLGIFAMYAGKDVESYGTVGASLQLLSEREVVSRHDLINGRHYSDAEHLEPICRIIGDGTSVETVGDCLVDGRSYRVDLLTIDVPKDTRARKLVVKDLGSPASFAIFDVFCEYQELTSCPFKKAGGGVTLADLGAAIRVGDRLKFSRALEQLDHSLDSAEDLDEARGQALTFLAVITAATLENGGGRRLHKVQLDAARELDSLRSRDDIREATRRRIAEVTDNLFAPSENPSDRLVDRALAIVERHYAKDLTDAMVAAQLGLSTSHFRYLFRQATGQPFHKYVVALRLEKAKQMLIEQEMPVSQIAAAVGFAGLSHFSRAFAQRFSASPSQVRRSLG